VDRAYKPNFRVHPLGSLKKMKFLIRGLGVLLGAVLAGWLYFYASDHIKIIQLDSIFDPAYGYPQGYREEYFAKTFPSSSDIESYLSNATLLISKPPLGNVIYYFDEYRHFTLWHDNIVEGGEWWLIPKLQMLRLGKQWRFAVVQSFCRSVSGMLADAQKDNCYSVESVDSLPSRGAGSRREYSKGNVFGLSTERSAPFQLPSSQISIASLLSRAPYTDR
jgi:hypothetical protein